MKFNYCILVFLSLLILSCSKKEAKQIDLPIIPKPVSAYVNAEGVAKFESFLVDCHPEFNLFYIDDLLGRINGIRQRKGGKTQPNLLIKKDSTLGAEAYKLVISPTKIEITAADRSGAQYGLQSLTQIIDFNGNNLPLVTIEDKPRFAYRGMHLDVGRHMFTVDEIKKYIDYLAEYKYNRLHWHLTEDQGWRIEIKKYPKLQEVAAFRKETLIGHYNDIPQKFDGKRYGGFYTQDEVTAIVRYAANRSIEVIPEIEMPGHSQAALAAYPELGCDGGPYEVATKWGVFENVFCPTEKTFEFLEDVIDEVVPLFPSKYIHIGGDECPKEAWKKSAFCQALIKEKGLKDEHGLQSYFIQRMEKYINSKGKQIIGWDEILEGGLAPNATVMSWRGIEGGLIAARQNHDVIMTPGSHCYFDHYQSDSPDEPLAIGGLTRLDKVYAWDPIPAELEEDKRKYILGGQANLWTEYISTYSKLEYMAFSRGLAMSEALWTGGKDYNEFLMRYEKHNDALKKKGINIANHLYDVLAKVTPSDKGMMVKFDKVEGMKVDVKLEGKTIKTISTSDSFALDKSGTYEFKGLKNGKEGKAYVVTLDAHKGTTASIKLTNPPADQYKGNGPSSVINGITGSSEKFSGVEWLGFEGKDFEADLSWKNEMDLNEVQLRFFKGEGQWIYLPKSVDVSVSTDGSNYKPVQTINDVGSDQKIAALNVNLGGIKAKHLKIKAANFGIIPDGLQGGGHGAWLFVDEIVVK